MKRTYPDYYDNFVCIADKCPETCCAGWQIEIDEEALKRYRDKKIETVDFKHECFKQDKEKRCKNLNEKGLCKLILEHGEDILCNTCRLFPRHIEEFENVREYSLSISCPEVAQYLIKRKEPVTYRTVEDREIDTEEYDSEEQLVYIKLFSLREAFFETVLDRTLSLAEKAGRILAIAREFQNQTDDVLMSDADLDSVDVERAKVAEHDPLKITTDQRYELFKVMKKWEYTGEEFKNVLKVTEKALYIDRPQDEAALEEEMRASLSAKGIDWDIVTEQILHYFLYIYFCGSAYDEYYYGQAQLAVAACLHLKDFAMARFKMNGIISTEDVIYFTYLYARELEHSVPNVLATERYMDEHPLVD
ncbi:MAG: flagellin lysine-N-methylase [Lachnospiraceae bacterium]|nr:flagellin lysine-N-methylase [Lachnospiraceae bacterium]